MLCALLCIKRNCNQELIYNFPTIIPRKPKITKNQRGKLGKTRISIEIHLYDCLTKE